MKEKIEDLDCADSRSPGARTCHEDEEIDDLLRRRILFTSRVRQSNSVSVE